MDGSFDIKFDGSLDTDEDKIAKVFDTMLKMTAYNDLYSKYALMQKCNTLSEFDSEVFEMLKNISSFDEFNDKISSSTELFSSVSSIGITNVPSITAAKSSPFIFSYLIRY